MWRLVDWCSCCPQVPSSVFWKELAVAMPRRVLYHSQSAGDPQTMLQDDKDPMLTLNPDYLDCNPDTDPAGDLGKGTVSHHTLTQPIILCIQHQMEQHSVALFQFNYSNCYVCSRYSQ